VGEVAQKESGAAPDPKDNSPRFYLKARLDLRRAFFVESRQRAIFFSDGFF